MRSTDIYVWILIVAAAVVSIGLTVGFDSLLVGVGILAAVGVVLYAVAAILERNE